VYFTLYIFTTNDPQVGLTYILIAPKIKKINKKAFKKLKTRYMKNSL